MKYRLVSEKDGEHVFYKVQENLNWFRGWTTVRVDAITTDFEKARNLFMSLCKGERRTLKVLITSKDVEKGQDVFLYDHPSQPS